MAYGQFNENLYLFAFDTDTTNHLGSFKTARNEELAHIRVNLCVYNQAGLGGSERIRTIVYGDPKYSNALYTSDWADIADIDGLTDDHSWIGWVRTDFNRKNINKGITYYLSCQFDNYTRNGDTFYMGLFYDYPYPVYDAGEDLFFDNCLAFQIFGYAARA